MNDYEVCVIVQAEAWLTVEADSEAAAKRAAGDIWSYSDLQNGVAVEVLAPDAEGVFRS